MHSTGPADNAFRRRLPVPIVFSLTTVSIVASITVLSSIRRRVRPTHSI